MAAELLSVPKNGEEYWSPIFQSGSCEKGGFTLDFH
jgi:hypothetical protein